MNLGIVLQAIISIVLIYLLLSLLTSELQEYLATLFEARAKRLKQSIRQMLNEENWNGKSFINDPKKPGEEYRVNNSAITNSENNTFSENNDEEKFIWVNDDNKSINDASIERDDKDKNKGIYKNIEYSKYLIQELDDEGQFYINKRIEKSITDLLYLHPNIIALNQKGFSWLSILEIRINFKSFKQNKWGKKEWLNLFSDISLIVFFIF